MKLAISTDEPELEAELDQRFGRCAWFVIIETETQEWTAHPNPAADAGSGAGLQSVQFLADQGVQAVVGPHFGPKAFTALEAAGIKPYAADGGQAEGLLKKYLSGTLEAVSQPNASMHHAGRGR